MFCSVKTDKVMMAVLHLCLRSLNICMLSQTSSSQIHAARFSSQ